MIDVKINNLVQNEILNRDILEQYNESIVLISKKLIRTFNLGKRLYLCGNGGSNADASHIASEFIKNFKINRKCNLIDNDLNKNNMLSRLQLGLPAFSLSNSENITAIANDMEYSLIYAQQVFTYCNNDDVLILFSTSGNSENIINAAITAKELGVYTIAFTGDKDNKLQSLSDYGVKVHLPTTAQIQETYMSIMHSVCAVVEQMIFDK